MSTLANAQTPGGLTDVPRRRPSGDAHQARRVADERADAIAVRRAQRTTTGRKPNPRSGPRTAPPGFITNPTVCARVGISYRQLDYWIRCAAITPASPPTGQGSTTFWREDQLPLLKFTAAAARVLASNSASGGSLVETLRITWRTISAAPAMLAEPVLYLDLHGYVGTEPVFGYCVPRSAWDIETEQVAS